MLGIQNKFDRYFYFKAVKKWKSLKECTEEFGYEVYEIK
jgi:hypothetical protein